jgi:hypothetical protein
MTYPKPRVAYHDADNRDWSFERETARLMLETDFLAIETPEEMPAEVVKRMFYDFERNRIEDTTRNRVMFLETQQLNQELRELNIVPEKVAPSRDGRGYVRMGFDEIFKLLDMIEKKD